jgi:hypothetical protein
MKCAASLIFVTAAAAALLATADATGADAKPIPGKDLFRDHCKTCHAAGSPNGEYTPMTLIGEQWARFFDRKYVRTHEGVIDTAHGGKPVTEVITPVMLEQIRKFAIDHAADSESPMTCG